MNQGSRSPAGETLENLFGRTPMMDRNNLKMSKVVLTFGLMLSSALASPMLFEFKEIWLFDVFVNFVSSAAFMLQNADEIKKWGPYTVAIASLLGIGAYSASISPQTPLNELPWFPVATVFALLGTVYIPRRIRQPRNPIGSDSRSMEEGSSGISLRSVVIPHGNGEPLDLAEINRIVAFMDHRAGSRLSQRAGDRESDIDLTESQDITRIALQRVLAVSGELNNGFTNASSDTPFGRHQFYMDFQSRSSTPESRIANARSSASISEGSEAQLLGNLLK